MKPKRTHSSVVKPAPPIAISAIWLVLGIAALATLNTIIATLTGRMVFLLKESDTRLPLDYLPQILQAEPVNGHNAWLIDLPLWIRLVSCVSSVILLAIVIVSGLLLHRIVAAISQGTAFSKEVLKNWKYLTLTLIIGGIAQGISSTITFAVLYQVVFVNPSAEMIGSNLVTLVIDLPRWPWWILLLGVISHAITHAFKSGAQLEKDVVGLV